MQHNDLPVIVSLLQQVFDLGSGKGKLVVERPELVDAGTGSTPQVPVAQIGLQDCAKLLLQVSLENLVPPDHLGVKEIEATLVRSRRDLS